MTSLKSSRSWSFAIITIVYIAAIAVGVAVFRIAGSSYGFGYEADMLIRLFLADLAATVFVWLWSVIFDNSSVYDPYWSVAPPLMISGYALHCGAGSLPVILVQVAVWLWAIRLTGNWAYTFPDLNRQDWRYDMYKTRFPRIWQLVNFTGIHLMPTVVVFLAMIPAFLMIDGSAAKDIEAGLWTWVGFVICISAATLQLVADTQAHRFRRNHRGQVCSIGLWNWSRHPNYLGEILMWWGVFVMYMSMYPYVHYAAAAGAIANTCLFVFISIPMMEKRQLANKPAYAEYRKRVRML